MYQLVTQWLWTVFGGLFLLSIVIPTEFVAPVTRYSVRSRLRGLLYWVLFAQFGGVAVMGLERLWGRLGVQPLVTIPVTGIAGDLAAVLLALLIYDFLGYWHHRALHRFCWPIHAVHHSQTELHAANGYGHFLEKGTLFLFFVVPFSFVEFNFPATPVVVATFLGLWLFYIHSPTTAHLGRLRFLIVDNRFHRIHHSVEPRHFDRNFGTQLAIWDRLFGTAYDPAPGEWPETGVVGHPPPRSVAEYLLYPLRFAGRQNAMSRSQSPAEAVSTRQEDESRSELPATG